jgi:hypothetical protein
MSDSPVQQPIEEGARRRLLRRKGWTQCLEGVFLVGVGVLVALILRCFFELAPAVPIVTSAPGLCRIIAGLVNFMKGWDRAGGKDSP